MATRPDRSGHNDRPFGGTGLGPLSRDRVRRQGDSGVRAVIRELGLDPDHDFARPVTDGVMRGTDVIVTMGHSVGAVEIPAGVRHQDSRVGDPVGARAEDCAGCATTSSIEFGPLLDELGVTAAGATATAAVGHIG